MLIRPPHSPANDVEETLGSALARWSRDPALAGLTAQSDTMLLVLDEEGTRLLHASEDATVLRSAVAGPDGRIFGALGLARQVARLGALRGSPRIVRLRFDARGLASPTPCRVAHAALGDGRKVLLVAPLDAPRVSRPSRERPAVPLPESDMPAHVAAQQAAAAASPARFVWRSDRDGVLSKVAAAQPDIVAGLEGRSWQALCAQAATSQGDALLGALREGRTFRSLTLALRLRPSGREVEIELSGSPSGRGKAGSGFSGFGIVRDRIAERPGDERARIAEDVSIPPSLLEPSAEQRHLSNEESAAFLEIAEALGVRPAPDDGEADAQVPTEAKAEHVAPAPANAPPASALLADTLGRLPLAIFVHRDADILFANRPFLDLGGFSDLDALRGVIGQTGFPAVGAEPGCDLVSFPSQAGETVALRVERSRLGWDGGDAELIVARRPPATPLEEPARTPASPREADLLEIAAAKTSDGERDAERRQAELAARSKLDFFAKAGQQVRTPLAGIMSLSDAMLAEQFGPLGSEQYRDYLYDIQASGSRALGLLNDLVELAEIEAGRMDLAFADLPLNDLVARCIAQMQPQAARDRIVFRTSLSPDLTTLVADERSMRQATLNAIAHAMRLTEPGGQVIVSTTLAERGEIALRVRDTGTGMTPSEVEQALEPFRLPMPGLSNDNGPGLGLTLAKALVEANRGRFRLSSRKDEGTLVEMVFSSALSA